MTSLFNARYIVSFLFIFTVLVLLFFDLKLEWQFSREGIAAGEWWRFMTAHFIHLNIQHGLVNLSLLAVLLYSLGTQLSLFRWLLSGAVLCLSISLGLLYFSLNVEWYVGFSGVLHGFLVLGLSFGAFKSRDVYQGFVLLLVVFKVIREQLPGFDIFHLADWLGGAVVVDAHFYGVIVGAILSAIFLLVDFTLLNVSK
ncbi:MAG: rhombosortase [Agarilytica sp.]